MSVGTLTRDQRGTRQGASTRAYALDRDTVLLALLILVAAALRFWRLRHQGFWFDEANTAQEVHDTPGQMLTLLKHYESTPPLYYCVAWVWARIFGFGEAGLRSLSALCGVFLVPVAYAAAAKLFSRRTALITAAFVATSPLLIWYSQEARAYELAILLSAISLLAFAYAIEQFSTAAIAAWTISTALALATEYYAVLVAAPTGLWLIHRYRNERLLRIWVSALGVWSAVLLWFAVTQNSTGHASWIKHLPLLPRVGQIFPQFLVGFGTPAAIALSWVAAVVSLVGLVLIGLHARRSADDWRHGTLIAAGIVGAGIIINALLLAVRIDNLLSRNVLALWLPLALLVAAGLGLRRTGWAGLLLTTVLCGTGVAAAIGVSVDRKYQRPDWRGVVRVLGTRPAAGVAQRAILIQNYRDVLPLSLYMPHLKAWHHTGTNKYSHYTYSYPLSELDVIAISSPHAPATGCWWGSACNLIPTQLQASYAIPGFRAVSIGRSHQFTILRLVASHPVTVSPEMVSAALTNTQLKYDDLLVQRASGS